MRKVLAVAAKELRQIRRDRRSLLILLFVPAFFLLVYGYALNFDIRNIRLAVQDDDRSSASRDVVSAFVDSGYFDLVVNVVDGHDVTGLLNRGDVRAVLVIPPRFGADAAAGRPTSLQFLINGDNANTATTVMGYAVGLVSTVSSRYEVQARLGSPAGALLILEPRVWYNPELRSTLFLVPGLIAYILMITAVISTALSIVREKESGTMEQVRMAPIDTFSFVVGKSMIILAAMVLFGLPMRGSWLSLLAALSLFIAGALGTGLLISTVAETQQVAFQAAMLTSFLPTLMLSGFIFPISSMPNFLQLVTHIVPARYFLIALRGIVLKGTPVALLWPQMLALSIYALAMLTLAAVRLARERH
jgi:ABC-2 type transport system permease protein